MRRPGGGFDPRLLTPFAAVPVVVVAFLAAVQSYSHIEALALANHQSLADARMLPFSVDFLIASGSVILLAGSRLGWLCVVSGVVATLFANVESGVEYGPLAATVAAWPAVAFTVASFVLERWLRQRTRPVPAVPAVPEPADTPEYAAPEPYPVDVPAVPEPEVHVPAESNGHDPDVSAVLAAGYPWQGAPSIRQVRDVLSCGQERAKRVQGRIRVLNLRL